MKRFFLSLLILSSAVSLHAQQVSYSLPQSVIVLDVDAVREISYAGPYAVYAKKLLGIDVRQKDETRSYIREIRMCVKVEADLQARHLEAPSKSVSNLLKMSSLGLVSFGTPSEAASAVWTFPGALPEADYSRTGVSAAFQTTKQTVYKDVKTDTSSRKVPVQIDVNTDKTLEQRATEAAEMILKARSERYKITVGDTDATYSGEALGSAIAELTRMENEYLLLFTGYTVSVSESKTFEVIPVKGTETYDVFRLSDTEGLISPESKNGKPFFMDVIPATIAKAGEEGDEASAKPVKGANILYYRIPAVCAITLGTGTTPYAETRFPIYQMGQESTYITK